MMLNPEARASQPVPWLFDGYGLAALVAATLLAASAAALPIALLAGTLLLLGLLARVWAALSPRRLSYSRRTVPFRAFCGDSLVLETSLSNRKPLPLPWLEAWERLPPGLGVEAETENSAEKPGTAWLCQGGALWPYQRARWRHQVQAHRRGVFVLDEVCVRSGDPFGLCERQVWLSNRLEVVVYPRVVPLQRLEFARRHHLAETRSRANLVRDPTRTAGVRDYRPGDPQRLVHWPASAHSGQLQVRILEPATTLQVWLAVEAGSFDLPWHLYRDTLFELVLSSVASIGVHLTRAGRPVGLLVRGRRPIMVPPSANPGQLQEILESLARLEPRASVDDDTDWPVARMARGSLVVLAASDLAHGLAETVAQLKHRGSQVVVLVGGQGPLQASIPAERVIHLVPGQDLAATLEGRL